MKFGSWLNSNSDWKGGLTPHTEKKKLHNCIAVAGAAMNYGIALPFFRLWFWAVQSVKTTLYIWIFVVMEFIFEKAEVPRR